jgi:hypothetical protein
MSIWKEIDGFKGYYINRVGEVKSTKGKQDIILKPYIDKDGYRVYSFRKPGGKKKAMKEHRLVAIAFIPNPKNLKIVNHKNGIKDDNRVSNLEWCTAKYNTQHAFLNGLLKTYNRSIKILDTKRDVIVSYFNSYEKLAEITGLSKVYLYEMAGLDQLLYGGFKIIRENNVDYSKESLFNNVFIKRTIHKRYKPLIYKGKVYESVKSFKEEHNISDYSFYKMQDINYISHYEYVTHE